MKHYFSILLLIALTSCFTSKDSANKKPIACFETARSHFKKNELVRFTNCSSDFQNVEWYFGDGSDSKLSEPEYKYPNPGVFTVRLKCFNGDNNDELSKSLWVADAIRVNYTLNWENSIAKQGDMIKIFTYYKREGDNTFYSNNSNEYIYFWGGTAAEPKNATLSIPDPTESFQLKLVAACYTYSGSTTLPDVLLAKDSIITSNFTGLTGPAVPQVTSDTKVGRLKQQYTMLYQ